MHGDKLLTPEQQACIQGFFNELGYTNTIVFEGYSIMYDFTEGVSEVDNREEWGNPADDANLDEMILYQWFCGTAAEAVDNHVLQIAEQTC